MSTAHVALAAARREQDLERSGIYQILCIKTQERYIGRTGSGFDKRWASHTYLLRKNAHGTAKLQARWNEYGAEAFQFSVLERCYVDQTIDREQAYLDSYKDRPEELLNSPNGSAKGPVRMSDSTKALMSAGRKGLPKSEEHAAAISEAKMGHSVSETTRAAISKTLSGRPGNPKAITAMAAANTGSTRTPEVVARASAWQDDPVKFDAAIAKAVETRKKNAKPNPAKGRPQTEEQKQAVARIRAEKIANGYVDPRIGRIPWNKRTQ
jgi:group I intron endonuclease